MGSEIKQAGDVGQDVGGSAQALPLISEVKQAMEEDSDEESPAGVREDEMGLPIVGGAGHHVDTSVVYHALRMPSDIPLLMWMQAQDQWLGKVRKVVFVPNTSGKVDDQFSIDDNDLLWRQG